MNNNEKKYVDPEIIVVAIAGDEDIIPSSNENRYDEGEIIE